MQYKNKVNEISEVENTGSMDMNQMVDKLSEYHINLKELIDYQTQMYKEDSGYDKRLDNKITELKRQVNYFNI